MLGSLPESLPVDAVVQVESVTHRYGERVALDGVSMSVGSGVLLGLLGPNGGGKTTLFKILTTLLTPTAGAAHIAGFNVVADRARVRQQIGIVFQHPSLDSKLTVRENVMHQGHLYGLRGRDLVDRRDKLLARFGLADRAGDRVDKLSGGLQRRVELAKGLLHEPRVLLLDEPSTGLDVTARTELMRTLRSLTNDDGVTCLLTTHLMEEADQCDQVAILDEGQLVAFETPDALKSSIGGDVITIHGPETDTLSRDIRERFNEEAIVMDGTVRIERRDGHAFVPQLIEAFPGRIDSVTVGKPTLADVFVHRTGHRFRA